MMWIFVAALVVAQVDAGPKTESSVEVEVEVEVEGEGEAGQGPGPGPGPGQGPGPGPGPADRLVELPPAPPLGGRGLERLVPAVSARVVRIYAERGRNTVVEASGFFVAPDLIVTAQHVLETSKSAAYRLAGSEERVGVLGVVAVDAAHDLALLKLSTPTRLDGLKPRAEPLALAERVFVVGMGTSPGPVFVEGRVGQAGTDLRLAAPVPIGLGGGAVVDERGRLVGVTKRRLIDDGELASAAPSDVVAALIASAGEPVDVAVWSKQAGGGPAPGAPPAQALAAGAGMATTLACLTAFGSFACGAPLVLGIALFASVGCAAGLAILLSGGAILLEIIQILTMPMGMSMGMGVAAAGLAGGAAVLVAGPALAPVFAVLAGVAGGDEDGLSVDAPPPHASVQGARPGMAY